MDMLNIPATSKARVITTMKAIIDAHESKKEYDPSAAIKAGRGAKVLIEDCTPQAEVVYRVMESGMSPGNTVVVLNQWRRRRTLEPISYGCLQRFVRSSAAMVLEKRETTKSGSKDEGATWAWARCQFAQQLKRQFRKGARIAASGPTYVAAEDGDDPAQVALELHIFRGGRGVWRRVPPQDHYPHGDARRIFGQGTPKEVWHLMEQTWTVVGVPTNARITEDISGWERVCDKIIEAKGTIVLDENFRTGRRARKMHGEGGRKTKLRKRDRKSTHLLDLPVHPALMGAYEDLLGPEGGGAAAEGP